MTRPDEAVYAAADRRLIDMAAEMEGEFDVIDRLVAGHYARVASGRTDGLLPDDATDLVRFLRLSNRVQRYLIIMRASLVKTRERRMARRNGGGHG